MPVNIILDLSVECPQWRNFSAHKAAPILPPQVTWHIGMEIIIDDATMELYTIVAIEVNLDGSVDLRVPITLHPSECADFRKALIDAGWTISN